MVNPSPFLERRRHPVHLIESEEEAAAIAMQLGQDFAGSSVERDVNRILAFDEMDRLSASGLLGISIPSDHGGLDISNGLLCEILASIAEADPSIGQALAAHYAAIDGLRGPAMPGAEALYDAVRRGERFASACFPAAAVAVSGAAASLTGRSRSGHGLLYADWIAIHVDGHGTGPLAFLPRGGAGLSLLDDWDGFGQRVNGAATVMAESIGLIAPPPPAPAPASLTPPPSSLTLLLDAAVDLGIAKASRLDLQRHGADAPLIPAVHLAEPAVKIEAAGALIARAGARLDRAQVDPTVESDAAALFSAAVARLAASQAALHCAERIFDLSPSQARSLTLDLDRHWRNARVTAPAAELAAGLSRIIANHPRADPQSTEGKF